VSDPRDPLRWRRWYHDGWVAFAPQKERLERATEKPIAEPGHPPAQIRIHLGNISPSKLSDTLRALAYVHARQRSGANALLLEALSVASASV
jgi:hypothetical protein